jgi:hypothetical protein
MSGHLYLIRYVAWPIFESGNFRSKVRHSATTPLLSDGGGVKVEFMFFRVGPVRFEKDIKITDLYKY